MSQNTPSLSPARRRILFALAFEAIGFVCSSLILLAFSHADTATATSAAAGCMVIALIYNYLFNWGFEAWEKRQSVKGRSLKRRLMHGTLFEAGLIFLMVPFLAWIMQITLWQAFLYDAGLLIFFAIYTVVFTWAFDRIFGLPASAR